MKTIKSTLLLITILGFAPAGRGQQPIKDDLKPPAKYERFYAAKVVDYKAGERKLYLGEYSYPSFKAGGFEMKDIALSLNVVPGYAATVCGTFAGTKRYLCLPQMPGQHKLNVFSDVSKITMSKTRRDDEVVLWYNTFPPTGRPIAMTYQLNTSYAMATPFPNPGKTWIPNGLWLRLCKSRINGRVSQCQSYTSDTGEIKGEFKVIEIGKGTPPPEPNRLIMPKPETKPLPKQKAKLKIKQSV